MSNNQDGFFAVDKDKFNSALALGMNPAISYLVIACGSGKSNTESSWSVHAIENYTSISRSRANNAVKKLIDNKVINKIKGGTKPRYKILDGRRSKKLEPASTYWLPNGIVMGVNGETPPLEQIRLSQNIMLLTLFIDLYSEQNLIENGGISQAVYRSIYHKRVINERAQYNVWGFSHDKTHLTWGTEIVDKHAGEGKTAAVDFFNRIEVLISIGLVERVTHLVDHQDDGEIIHELDDELINAAYDAALALLSDHHGYQIEDCNFLIPVERHLTEVTVMTTVRTVYKPRTIMTGSWYSDYQKRKSLMLEKYNNIITKYGSNQSNVVGFN